MVTAVKSIHRALMGIIFKYLVLVFITVLHLLKDLLQKKSSSSYHARYICSECFQNQDGYLYERPGKGQKIISYTEHGKYCDDTSDALRHIRRWMISVAESNDNKLQERLLSLITLTLAVFDTGTIEKSSSEMKVAKLLSKLFVKTALRMGKVELNRLTKRPYIVSLEKTSMMEEKLEREILFLHSEI